MEHSKSKTIKKVKKFSELWTKMQKLTNTTSIKVNIPTNKTLKLRLIAWLADFNGWHKRVIVRECISFSPSYLFDRGCGLQCDRGERSSHEAGLSNVLIKLWSILPRIKNFINTIKIVTQFISRVDIKMTSFCRFRQPKISSSNVYNSMELHVVPVECSMESFTQ